MHLTLPMMGPASPRTIRTRVLSLYYFYRRYHVERFIRHPQSQFTFLGCVAQRVEIANGLLGAHRGPTDAVGGAHMFLLGASLDPHT